MINIFEKNVIDFSAPLVIDSQEVLPGESSIIKLNVGRLPSDTRISITAHVIRSRYAGPTGLILAGVHGDEINGIEIVRGLMSSGEINKIKRGNLILIPLLNVFGFINFSRDVPDGKDVNRSFPGTFRGSLASRVARVITKKILPLTDFALDFHTGGASRYNFPQVRYYKKDPISEKIAIAFGAKYTVQKSLITKSFRKVCYDMKIPSIVYEGGESIRLNGYTIEKAKEGIQRTLQSLDMLDIDLPELENHRLVIKKTSWVRAPHSGIFIWTKKSGTFVNKGEPLGEINDPYGTKSITVHSSKSGYIIGHNNASVVNHGDALFHIGYEYDEIK